MKVLLVGSGGREHALAWKIRQSKLVDTLYCAPGNGGISQVAECVPIKADDIKGLLEFALKEGIGLTVVGPEVPLSLGIADEFQKAGLAVFGPRKDAAFLEASKVFSKELMARHKVPTAQFRVFDDPRQANVYIARHGAPCVVKADGLAAGKGVVVAQTVKEAQDAVNAMMQEKVFGQAGAKVIVEECLEGEEASILVFTDGKDIVPLASSQDHKRVFDGDQGPNTGGMGAYSPAPVVTDALFREILDTIVGRTISGLAKEGIKYSGVLYAGVMITKDGPKALEFNVRFGDPETEAIVPRMRFDLVEVLLAVSKGRLSDIARSGKVAWDPRACVCVVCAAPGYPGEYKKGLAIEGLDRAGEMKDVAVFHAGTVMKGSQCLTSGGRVLAVSGLGGTIKEAIGLAYEAVGKISFEGMHFRRDIGRKAFQHTQEDGNG